jgi:hypothetical protein
MYQNQTITNPANWQLADGMTVFATDGTKVGTLRNYDPDDGYLDVRKGWLFTRDFYVPFSAVESVAEDGVVLCLTKDALEDDRYAAPWDTTDATPGAYSWNAPTTGTSMAGAESRLDASEDGSAAQ